MNQQGALSGNCSVDGVIGPVTWSYLVWQTGEVFPK